MIHMQMIQKNMAVNNYSRINDQALIDRLTKARADADEKTIKS